MFRSNRILLFLMMILMLAGCSTAYKAKPLPFKSPDAYANQVQVKGVQIGGQAYVDATQANKAFGFDIRGAGMLPVQLVFDNQGQHKLSINPGQTFLEDDEGNLWPILSDRFAYERATKYAQTKQIFKEGAYDGFLGATAGALIGAAIGIVSGEDVAASAGKGAALGGAAGATVGGMKGAADSHEARNAIVSDLRDKSLENKFIKPGDLAHGIIFFPGEAASAKQLRLQLKAKETEETFTVFLQL